MIKIQYANLPAGLHIRTAVEGRHTILYLLPGLTTNERRAAIGRARSNARVGYGPPLPAPRLAAALISDQIRTTIRRGYAALRGNPVVLVLSIGVVASVSVAYLLLTSVSIQFRQPDNAGSGPRPGGLISAAPGYPPVGGSVRVGQRGASDPSPAPSPAGPAAGGGGTGPAGRTGPAPSPSSQAAPSGSPGSASLDPPQARGLLGTGHRCSRRHPSRPGHPPRPGCAWTSGGPASA